MENPCLGPISHVEKPFFCCIFTNSARIKTINIDLKPPFEGGHGQLILSGTWWHCGGGVLFHYRSIVDFQMMALPGRPPEARRSYFTGQAARATPGRSCVDLNLRWLVTGDICLMPGAGGTVILVILLSAFCFLLLVSTFYYRD